MPDFTAPPWSDWVPTVRDTIGASLLIVLLAIVGVRAARVFVHGVIKTFDRDEPGFPATHPGAIEIANRRATIETLGSRVIQGFILIVAALMILDRLGYEIGPAVAGFGVVGIAVGFGAQSLVRDYFNGSLILLENQFSIGDVVTIAGVTGTVEDLTLRRTTLRDTDGVVHTVPNGEIRVASNRTRTGPRRNRGGSPPPAGDRNRANDVGRGPGPAPDG